jgi:hypothetical protein
MARITSRTGIAASFAQSRAGSNSALSEKIDMPLHPSYLYFWEHISPADVLRLRSSITDVASHGGQWTVKIGGDDHIKGFFFEQVKRHTDFAYTCDIVRRIWETTAINFLPLIIIFNTIARKKFSLRAITILVI